ncbi:MAG TPA: ATP-dependent sacrificial sulfur transferase LarE [Myxococcaceae bacterium]
MLSPERIDELCAASASKLEAMRALVRAQESALVAFSAGVDSTLVLKIAAEELGARAVALTAISASMAPEEQGEARALAEQIGVRLVEVRSKEVEDPRYAQNPVNRCYFCKTELYDLCAAQKASLGVSAILDGFNADDFKDHRPGHQAAREHQVVSPLAAAGLGKEEIRAWSRRLGLPTWDKPQMACLASRIPYGTSVTPERLSQLAGAETDLRRLGLRTFRVRYHGEVARLEVAAEEQDRFFSAEFRARVNEALQARGFRFVSLDLEPFRSGRMNQGLALPVVS